MKWNLFESLEINPDAFYLFKHQYGIEGVRYWGGVWRYWYSASPVGKQVLDTVTHYCVVEWLDESTPAPEISFYCRAKDEENYLCEAQCERCAKADKFELPAPEITEDWMKRIIREYTRNNPSGHLLATNAIMGRIGPQIFDLKTRLAAKEKENRELLRLLEIEVKGRTTRQTKVWEKFKQQHNL